MLYQFNQVLILKGFKRLIQIDFTKAPPKPKGHSKNNLQVINQRTSSHKLIIIAAPTLVVSTFLLIATMCFVYETPSNSYNSTRDLQCPPTPRKYRVAKDYASYGDPMFFPSSSSILGSRTCVTESTCDTADDSLLDSINELPVTVLVLKPTKSGNSNASTSRRRKLSISDLKGGIPPLPYKVPSSNKKPMNRASSDPDQSSAGFTSSKLNTAKMSRMTIKTLPGSRRRSLNAKCA